MEPVRAFKHLAHPVNLEEGSATATAERTAEICYLVVEVDIFLLSQHSHCSEEELLRRDLLLLKYWNHTIAEIKPTL